MVVIQSPYLSTILDASSTNYANLYQGNNSAPTPPPDVAQLVAWYRADKLVTSVGGVVSAWGDSSSTGDSNQNLTQSNALLRPTLNTTDAAYNNQPTISFTIVASSAISSGTWATALTAPFTICWVGNYDGGASAQNFVSSTGQINELQANNGSGNACMYGGGGFVVSNLGNTASPQIVIGVYDAAANSKLFVSAKTALATGSTGGNSFTDLTLGYWAVSGAGLQGTIAEVLIYDAALSAANINAVLTELGTRYNIAIGS